jgi:2-isopropylmalate synthase
MTGQSVAHNQPVVGANAFAHEAGIHQDGVIKDRRTYEIMTPESVGWRGESIVIGKHSGKAGIVKRLDDLGYRNLTKSEVDRIYKEVMALCDRQKSVSDNELTEIAGTDNCEAPKLFSLERAIVGSAGKENTATVWIRRNGDSYTASASGNGPIHAAINATVKASGIKAKFEHYSSDALGSGADAVGQVTVEVRALGYLKIGRAGNENSITAAVTAFLNALNRILAHEEKRKQETV